MILDQPMRERIQKLVWELKQAAKDAAPIVDFARGPHPDLNDSAKRLGCAIDDTFDRAEKFLDLYDRRLTFETNRQKGAAS